MDRLPLHGHYATAYTSSDEYLAWASNEVERRRETDRPLRAELPSQVGWSPQVARIVDLNDAVRELTNVVAFKDSGKRPPRQKPLPRPMDPFARAQARAEERRHQDRIALLTPWEA